MWDKYERQVYQFLSVYRFLSYALAVMFFQIDLSITTAKISDTQMIIILASLGIYSLLKVFSPFRWREKGAVTYVILVGDFLICLLLVIFTSGLNSVFLLYSLTPIMSAALFFEEKIALSLASVSVVVLSLVHLLTSKSGAMQWFVQGYNLTMLIIYALFSFVSALVPYRINLNIRRRIEREAILEERRRIGREIHDGVAQALSYINIKTKLIKDMVSANNKEKALVELDDIHQVIHDSYEDVRESIDQLSSEKKNLPLIPALHSYIDDFKKNNNIAIHFDPSRSFPALSPVVELQLLRIVQEGLTNVRKHAQATKIMLTLTHDAGAVEMILQDNGLGFDVASKLNPLPGHHGLNIMQERATELGGSVVITSSPGKGTEIKVNLPVEKVRF